MGEKTERVSSDIRIIDERYRIEEKEYETDKYISYIAFDEKMDTNVRIFEILGESDAFVEKLKKLINVTQKINEVYKGLDYISTEGKLYYIEESDDSKLINELDYKELCPEKICFSISNILGKLHENGIIHGNISPNTIYINKDNVVKTGHLIAGQMLRENREKMNLYPDNIVYAAPEYCGFIDDNCSAKTDIYSLCMLFIRLKTGDMPYPISDRINAGREVGLDKIKSIISDEAFEVLKKGIEIKPSERDISLSRLRDVLFTEDYVKGNGIDKNKGKKKAWIKFITPTVVAAAAAASIGIYLTVANNHSGNEFGAISQEKDLSQQIYEGDYTDIFLNSEDANSNVSESGVYEDNAMPISDLMFLEDSEYSGLKELRLTGAGRSSYVKLTDLKGIEHLSDSLEKLYLDKNDALNDISPLSKLKNLKFLSLSEDTNITDFSPVTKIDSLISLNMNAVRNDGEDEKQFGEKVKILSSNPNLKAVSFKNNGLTDISFVNEFDNLEVLDISDNPIKNLNAVSEIDNLRYLLMDNTTPEDLGFLKDSSIERLSMNGIDNIRSINDITKNQILNNLRKISLKDCENLEDLNGLKNIPNLVNLHLRNTKVSDISILEDMTGIEILNIDYTSIKDVTPLKSLTNIKQLYMSDLHLSDINVLEGMNKLEIIRMIGNDMRDINALKGAKGLKQINLGQSANLEDISALSDKNLERFTVSGAPLTSIDSLKNSADINYLYINNCPIRDVSVISDFGKLTTLHLNNMDLSDLSFLKNLKNLKTLTLTGTKVTDVSFLENLDKLEFLNIEKTGMSEKDVHKLQTALNKCIIESDF